MSDADDAFVRATDDLIGLYRGVERRTLDLPWLSVMPTLLLIWALVRFEFFFVVGVFLIVPTNLVIFIRNFFPGHWRYRPFFLHHVYYAWLWIWRGEAPTVPFVFIRPLLNVFMKAHFKRRLRRLRLEMQLRDGLADATRSALQARLDAALELWKSPRFAAVSYSLVLPGIASFPGWYKQFTDLLGSFGANIPTAAVADFASHHISNIGMQIGFGYLLAIPVSVFLAKRGLFIGRDPNRIWFPGGQEGSGFYSKEREILGSVGLHAREAPVDLWLLGITSVLGMLFLALTWDQQVALIRSLIGEDQMSQESAESRILIQMIITYTLLFGLLVIAALRRARTGRA